MRRRLPAMGLALVLAAGSACTQATPEETLLSSVQSTLDASFSFVVSLEPDASALADLGDRAAGGADFLSSLSIHGVIDGPSTSLEILGLGGSLLELRQVVGEQDEPASLFLRAGIVDLLTQVGVEEFAAEQLLVGQLEQSGASPAVLDAVRQAFDGGWIAVPGGLGDALATGGSGGSGGVGPNVFVDGLAAFFDDYVDVASLGEDTFRAGVHAGDLLRGEPAAEVSTVALVEQLGSLPEVVALDALVAGGRLAEFAFDVAQARRAFGQDATGQFVVRVIFDEHGRAGPIEAPSDAAFLSRTVLDEAVALLFGSLGLG